MDGDTRSTEPSIEMDLGSLARDWLTLWQSEFAALAADREALEAWQKLIALWTGAAGSLAAAALDGSGAGRRDRPDGSTAAAPRPAAAAAAPDPRDAEIERLRGRVAALERRLAEIERQQQSADGAARVRARRRPGGKPKPP